MSKICNKERYRLGTFNLQGLRQPRRLSLKSPQLMILWSKCPESIHFLVGYFAQLIDFLS